MIPEMPEGARQVFLLRSFPVRNPDGNAGWMPYAVLDTAAQSMARHLDGCLNGSEFAQYHASELRRTKESIRLLRPRAEIVISDSLGPGKFSDWEDIMVRRLSIPRECYRQSPALLDRRGAIAWDYIRKVAASLRPGQRALVCSHSPLLESALAFAWNRWPPQKTFEKGSLGVLTFYREAAAFSFESLTPPQYA